MRKRSGAYGLSLRVLLLAVGIGLAVSSGWAQEGGSQSGGQGGSGWRGGRGFGMGPGGARGLLGTVTAVAADHYTIKTQDGTLYTVHFSANTHIMKGGGPRRGSGQRDGGQRDGGQGNAGQGDAGQADGGQHGGERVQPQPLKASDIKVGDVISAGGELDETAKSIGAVFIAQLDPERVKQMREMEANYGKTWLAGQVTSVAGTTITIDGMVDHAKHTIEVDENTSFRKRRESVTLADIQPGMQLRAEGALQGGGFRATSVTASEPRREGGPGQGPGPGAGPGGGTGAPPPGA